MTEFAKGKSGALRSAWFALGIILLVCATVVTAQAQPVIQCPEGDVTVCLTQLGAASVPLVITGATDVVIEGLSGATWLDGTLFFAAEATGPHAVTVRAIAGEFEDTCTFTVAVSVGQPPTLICPTEPFRVEVCGPTEICIALPGVSGAGQVTSTVISTPTKSTRALAAVTPIRTVGTEQCCIFVDTTGTYEIEVVATNACGADTCVFAVHVTVGTAPVISCPTEYHKFQVCELEELEIPLTVTGATLVDVTGPVAASWANGSLTFTPDAAGDFSFVVTATGDCGVVTCTVDVTVELTPRPTIVCPEDTVDFKVCAPERVCVSLAVLDAGDVSVSTPLAGASWFNDSVCFDISESGVFPVTVIATNECGPDTCQFVVRVTRGDAPTIACITDTLPIKTCESEVCIEVPLEFGGADSVVVGGGATWEEGNLLCFTAPTSGLYSFLFTAYNACGIDTCRVFVDVLRPASAVIACPTEPFKVIVCGNDELCVYVPITGASSVTVEGADWNNDSLCFRPNGSGEHEFTLIANGDCGSDTCTVVVNVVWSGPAVISCPDSTALKLISCLPGELCFTLPITGADSVEISQGTWIDNQVCFNADTAGLYEFTATAYSACVNNTCTFAVLVVESEPAVITCPDLDPMTFSSCTLGVVCFPLVVSGADSVAINLGTWANNEVCFTPDTVGQYTFTAIAYQDCGNDTCEFTVTIGLPGVLPELCFSIRKLEEPLTVQFVRCDYVVPGAQYTWNFGDNTSSSEAAPAHTFAAPGCYDVTLLRVSECGRDSLTLPVCVSDGEIVIPTDQWISIYCATPTMDEVALEPGDIITAYDPDGVLAGMGVVEPDRKLKFMPIYHDDIYSPELDEGAEEGDTIQFKVNGIDATVDPPVVWTALGDRFNVCDFKKFTGDCLTLEFKQGWNLVSWNVAYEDDIANLVAQLGGCVDFVLGFEQGGLTYDPQLVKYSTLHQVDYASGYWFYMNCPASLQLCNGPIPSSENIQVYAGWNLVSYWPTENLTVENGWESILSNIEIAYTYVDGIKLWKPGQDGFNTLTDLMPEYGYWLKSLGDDVLAYPGWAAPGAPLARTPGTDALGVPTTRNWISLYGENLSLDGMPLQDGALIEARALSGAVCGKGTYSGGILKFTPVYGEDNSDEATKSYPATGEQVTLYVNGIRVYADVQWSENGAQVQLSALSSTDGPAVPNSFLLAQNYPNPFNPTTQITFSLPTSGQVTLDIYNVMGQKIKTIVNGSYEAGEHSVTWDATDASGRPVAGGVYLYRLTSGTYEASRKMVLIK